MSTNGILSPFGRRAEPVTEQNDTGHVVPEPTSAIPFSQAWRPESEPGITAHDALHQALDELLDADAAERNYVTETAPQIGGLTTPTEIAARMLHRWTELHEVTMAAKRAYGDAYDAAILESAEQQTELEGRIFAAVTTPESIGLNRSLHRAEADTCTRVTGCWKKLAHPDDAGKDDTSWCNECERAFYPEAQP